MSESHVSIDAQPEPPRVEQDICINSPIHAVNIAVATRLSGSTAEPPSDVRDNGSTTEFYSSSLNSDIHATIVNTATLSQSSDERTRAEHGTDYSTTECKTIGGFTQDTTNNTGFIEQGATRGTRLTHCSVNSCALTENKRTFDISLPEPPDDWAFNNFLTVIADSMGQDELKTVKHLFIGAVDRERLDKMITFHELFRELRDRTFLSRNNLIYLQQCLKVIGRIDLVKKAVDFGDRTGNVLYFSPATLQPENGYRYIKFHIKGHNFESYNRDDLDSLRARLSKILCVPPEFVLFAGIQRSASLLITVMIPEKYVEVMEYILENNLCIKDFQQSGIDLVYTESKTFKILENKVSVVDASKEEENLTTIYQQLQKKTRLLETSELRVIELEKQLAKTSDATISESKTDSSKAASGIIGSGENSEAPVRRTKATLKTERSVSLNVSTCSTNEEAPAPRPFSDQLTRAETKMTERLNRKGGVWNHSQTFGALSFG